MSTPERLFVAYMWQKFFSRHKIISHFELVLSVTKLPVGQTSCTRPLFRLAAMFYQIHMVILL